MAKNDSQTNPYPGSGIGSLCHVTHTGWFNVNNQLEMKGLSVLNSHF